MYTVLLMVCMGERECSLAWELNSKSENRLSKLFQRSESPQTTEKSWDALQQPREKPALNDFLGPVVLWGARSSIIVWGSGSSITQTMMLKPKNGSEIEGFRSEKNPVCLFGDLELLMKMKEQPAVETGDLI